MTMELIYAFLIALANNVDTVGVRVAYSLKGIKVPFGINLWIAFIALVVSALAAKSGQLMALVLPGKLGNIVSMILLIMVGLWLILEPFFSRNKEQEAKGANMLTILADPVEADRDNSKHIDLKEATILGIALSLNNIGGGLSAGILGINPAVIGVLSAFISILVFWMGNRLIGIIKHWNLGVRAPVAAGVLLIVIGIRQIF